MFLDEIEVNKSYTRCRHLAKLPAQHGSQRTPLARPVSWRFFRALSRAVARLDL